MYNFTDVTQTLYLLRKCWHITRRNACPANKLCEVRTLKTWFCQLACPDRDIISLQITPDPLKTSIRKSVAFRFQFPGAMFSLTAVRVKCCGWSSWSIFVRFSVVINGMRTQQQRCKDSCIVKCLIDYIFCCFKKSISELRPTFAPKALFKSFLWIHTIYWRSVYYTKHWCLLLKSLSMLI